ncbi:MAG TPA: ABC transporter permease [Edaphobacter sp.]|jgi:putative ABC transport system permease protein|nr:ABC transporter permease [Edaphobacter sp.]
MFFRLLMESFLRQRRRKLLAGIAILLGTTAVTAMLALATTIGDRIHKELAVYGANIIIYPKADQLEVKVGGIDIKPASSGSYLKESDLEKIKGIFWANNITGVSPELDLGSGGMIRQVGSTSPAPVSAIAVWFNVPFGQLSTGAIALHPWWKIHGQVPLDYLEKFGYYQVLVGSRLAKQLNLSVGDRFSYTPPPGMNILKTSDLSYQVVGVLSSGDQTEEKLVLPLKSQIYSDHGKLDLRLSRVELTARTKPEDAFARKNPDTLSPRDHDRWYCSPYANSIAYQIREAIPGAQAEQVRRVEQSEGNVLKRISGLMWLISAAALLAAGFAVSAAMATAILERRGEIGLMRSLGASKAAIALLFYSETGLLAIFAGTLGYLAGSGLAAWLGARIFRGDGGSPEAILIPVLLPVVVALALAVAIGGSTPSIRAALRMNPSAILREDA